MDRTSVVTEFRSIVWTCPKCGQEDHQSLHIGGGDKREHVCSACGTWLNGPVGRPGYLVYHGTLKTDPSEYEKLDSKALSDRKQARVSEWINTVKNPPKAGEPTAADLEREQADLLVRAAELDERIKAAPDYAPPTPEKLREKRAKMVADLQALDDEIKQRPELPTVVEELEAESERLKGKAGRIDVIVDGIKGKA